MFWINASSQIKISGTSGWKETLQKRQGKVSVLWYDIEPFIYRNSNEIIGVEYELMEEFRSFVKKKYQVDLEISWVDAGSFENIYPYISSSAEKGLFGLSFYSITDERKKEVKFSPPYMPDLNVLVTNQGMPVFETDQAFIRNLSGMKSFTMKQTTMEEDLLKIKKDFYPSLPIFNEVDDYEVLKQIALYQNSFGYVPVSIYVIALQRGIKIKRQSVMATRREGFAAIYTKTSDWDEPVNAYFNSDECKLLVSGLIKKYLGNEVADIILSVSGKDKSESSDIELLTKEREIVTQRLIDTALDAERSKTQRNVFLIIGGAVLIIAAITFSRFKTKNRLSKILQQRNSLIAEQKKKMEVLNGQLNMKILQSKLNPHFLFNSLNSIQYHISTDDKKGALHYITRFSGFLRKVLQTGDEILINVQDEAALAEQYLWLEQSRFPDKFRYQIKVGNGAENYETPPMLIHNIVQEALYNNILNSNEIKDPFINIEFSAIKKTLLIRINDNGISKIEGKLIQEKKGLPETDTDRLLQRLLVINRSAINPVHINYQRIENENIYEISIPQPLFHILK